MPRPAASGGVERRARDDDGMTETLAGFERVLDAVDHEAWARGRAAFVNPLALAAPPISEGPRAASAIAGAFDDAMAWIGEPAPTGEQAFRGDDSETVARELGPLAGLSRDALTRLRRRYMWANHPDRCADAPRERANRRVAIANMLIDRALATIGAKEA